MPYEVEMMQKDTLLNDANDAFVTAEISKALKQAFEDIETPEIRAINELLVLLANKAKKPEQEQFVQAHPEVQWAKIEANKNGTFAVGKVKAYLNEYSGQVALLTDLLSN